MSPDEKRAGRLRELTKLVQTCISKGMTDPLEIIKVIRKRAYEMASKPVAEGYVEEIIRRFSK